MRRFTDAFKVVITVLAPYTSVRGALPSSLSREAIDIRECCSITNVLIHLGISFRGAGSGSFVALESLLWGEEAADCGSTQIKGMFTWCLRGLAPVGVPTPRKHIYVTLSYSCRSDFALDR